jgi:polyphosphate kinase 2 (PPK2 family)
MKTNIVTACPGQKVRLSEIDADETAGMSKEEALQQIAQLREKVSELQQILYAEHRQSLLIVFQAMDTGGKDGTIRKLLSGINPAGIRVTSFKVPSRQELDHDFLWRTHKATPPKGLIGVWNRSHYEDVLVVRVHKLVERDIWKSRFDQINSFERILTSNGTTTGTLGQSGKMVEVQPFRSQGARFLGRLSGGLRGGNQPLFDRFCTVACRPGESQMGATLRLSNSSFEF